MTSLLGSTFGQLVGKEVDVHSIFYPFYLNDPKDIIHLLMKCEVPTHTRNVIFWQLELHNSMVLTTMLDFLELLMHTFPINRKKKAIVESIVKIVCWFYGVSETIKCLLGISIVRSWSSISLESFGFLVKSRKQNIVMLVLMLFKKNFY